MLGYMVDIIRMSRQFKWPSCVMYNANYHREAAATGQTDRSKIDPSLYACCFTGWAHNTGWCDVCMTLDHDATDWPYNQVTDGSSAGIVCPRRLLGGQLQTPLRRSTPHSTNVGDAVCMKYNKYGDDCIFGTHCHLKAHLQCQCKRGVAGGAPQNMLPQGGGEHQDLKLRGSTGKVTVAEQQGGD